MKSLEINIRVKVSLPDDDLVHQMSDEMLKEDLIEMLNSEMSYDSLDLEIVRKDSKYEKVKTKRGKTQVSK
jgi:hypothetical protein